MIISNTSCSACRRIHFLLRPGGIYLFLFVSSSLWTAEVYLVICLLYSLIQQSVYFSKLYRGCCFTSLVCPLYGTRWSVCFLVSWWLFYHFKPAPGIGRGVSENAVMEFEAKSGRDGAWLVFLLFHVYTFFSVADFLMIMYFTWKDMPLNE